jgi:hypothetical protein
MEISAPSTLRTYFTTGEETGVGTGTGTGAELGTDDGVDQGAELGTDDGVDHGAELGTDDGVDHGAELGTDDGADVGSVVTGYGGIVIMFSSGKKITPCASSPSPPPFTETSKTISHPK